MNLDTTNGPRRGQFYSGVEWLACWLLDNAEGETITEEQLGPWAAKAWGEHIKRSTPMKPEPPNLAANPEPPTTPPLPPSTGGAFPFECENCDCKPTPQEVLDHKGDCAKCGDTVVTYTVDAAECILRLMPNEKVIDPGEDEFEPHACKRGANEEA